MLLNSKMHALPFFQKGIKEIKEINKLQQNLMKSKPVTVKNHFKNLIAFYPICVIFFKEKYNQYNFFFKLSFYNFDMNSGQLI